MADILVIEDEQALVDVIKTVLSAKGHNILQANDGESGLEAARRQRPDLIIADNMLPLMTGLDVCRAIREQYPDPPVPYLLMTAGNVPVEDTCPDQLLRKPFPIEELERIIDQMLQPGLGTIFQ